MIEYMIFNEDEMIELCNRYGIEMSEEEELDTNFSMKELMKEPIIDIEDKIND